MIKDLGLVSIIMPNYNCEKYISETIQSVINQTYTNWELIIIDDCSTDKSSLIAEQFSLSDSRIHFFKNELNSGAALSRNFALDKARGKYIAFLDSDDIWEYKKLEKQLLFMEENNCDFSYCKYDLIDENGVFLNKVTRVIDRLTYFRFLHHDFVGCLTVIYKFEDFKQIRSFDLRNNNDYGLFLQIIKKAKNALGLQEVLAHYRIRKNSISRNKFRKVGPYFELMHNYLHLPYIISAWFLFINILIGKFWKYEK